MSTVLPEKHLVIVGGGMAGALLAYALQPYFVGQITIIEKRSGDFESGVSQTTKNPFDDRSLTLSRPTVEFLYQQKIWSSLVDFVCPIEQIQVSRSGQFGCATLRAADSGLKALGYVVPAEKIGEVLLQHLHQANASSKKNSTVSWIHNATVASCKAGSQGWMLEVLVNSSLDNNNHKIDKRQVKADFCLIADGAHSNMRSLMGIQAKVTEHLQTAMVTLLEVPAVLTSAKPLQPTTAYEFFLPEGESLALVPRKSPEKNRYFGMIWVAGNHTIERSKNLTPQHILNQLAHHCGLPVEGLGQVRTTPTFYPLQTIIAAEQVRPGLAVIGNAAHALHPIAGQGFNLCVRDIKALQTLFRQTFEGADTKSTGLPTFAQLLAYEKSRLADQRRIAVFCQGLLTTFARDDKVFSTARQLALSAFDLCTPAKNTLSRGVIAPR